MKRILWLLFIILGFSSVFGAITHDSTTTPQSTTGTSLTFTHNTSGDDRALVVFGFDANAVNSTVTGITYDGVAMTKKTQVRLSGDRWVTMWYLLDPALGSNDVVVSSSSSTALFFSASSYNGVDSIGVHANENQTVAQSISNDVLVDVANSWTLMGMKDGAGGRTYTSNTGDTVRYDAGGGGLAFADTNAGVSVGTNLMSFNISGASTGVASLIMVIEPLPTPSLSIENVSTNGNPLTNGTIFDTDTILVEINITNTSTNTNINTTAFLYNTSSSTLINSTQIGTNTAQPNSTFNLDDGNYSVSFFAENNETNTSTGNYTFIVDTTAPILSVTNNTEINFYNGSFDSIINVSDTSPFTCLVTTDESNVTNCNSISYNWSTNGNHTFNVSVNDSAGNNAQSLNNRIFVNPSFTRFFQNDSTLISNFSINGTIYDEFFNATIYDYGLGEHLFTFQKTGFNDINFTVNFTSNFSQLNDTIVVDPAFITFQLKETETGGNAPNGNYTLFITNVDTEDIDTYSIENDNSLTIANEYANDTTINIRVVGNTSLSSTIEIITARTNVTVPIYITFQDTEPRPIEVLTADLLVIPNTDVYLYKYISNSTFVLETIAKTNVLGQVVFNIVENTSVYNICNTFQGNQKCLNQVTFVNSATDPFQIVHDSNATANEIKYLGFIEWNFENESITNITERMTMTFEDSQSVVSGFCYNVSRTTNGSVSFLGEFCNNNPSGQVVQTFSLEENQFLKYTFYYIYEGQDFILSTFFSYGPNSLLSEPKEFSILDTVFLIIYFGAISLFLSFKKFSLYNAGFLLVLLIIIGTQAFIQERYVTGLVWIFLMLKTVTFYFVMRRQ